MYREARCRPCTEKMLKCVLFPREQMYSVVLLENNRCKCVLFSEYIVLFLNVYMQSVLNLPFFPNKPWSVFGPGPRKLRAVSVTYEQASVISILAEKGI